MAVFKHTRGGSYYDPSITANLSTPAPAPAATAKKNNYEDVAVNKPGFFSTSSDLGNPIAWQPGFITEIAGNRFSMKGVNGETGKYPFFIPANEFDPEDNYKKAQNNVYQVIFGSQLSKRAKINVGEVKDLPDSFKKWAEMKSKRQDSTVCNAPVPRPSAPLVRPTGTPSEIRISSDFTLRVGSRYLFSNDASSLNSFRQATLLVLMPDRMVTTDGDFTFVLDPAKAGRDNWKKYVVSTKPQPGAPTPPQRPMSSSEPQSMTDTIKEKREGRAGIDRPLMEDDAILVCNGSDKTNTNNWYTARFIRTTNDGFQTNGGQYSLVIPKDIADEVGLEDAIERFILKVVDGEIKALNS